MVLVVWVTSKAVEPDATASDSGSLDEDGSKSS